MNLSRSVLQVSFHNPGIYLPPWNHRQLGFPLSFRNLRHSHIHFAYVSVSVKEWWERLRRTEMETYNMVRKIYLHMYKGNAFTLHHMDRINILRVHPLWSEEMILSSFGSIVTGTDSSKTIENNKAGKAHKSTRWVCWLKYVRSEVIQTLTDSVATSAGEKKKHLV